MKGSRAKVEMGNGHSPRTDSSNCVGEEQQITINISVLEGGELEAILLNASEKPLLSEHVVVAVTFDIPRLWRGKAQ